MLRGMAQKVGCCMIRVLPQSKKVMLSTHVLQQCDSVQKDKQIQQMWDQG